MNRLLLLLLILLSGNVYAVEEEEEFDPTELYVIGLCHNTAAFVEQIAVERDKGRPKKAIQNALLQRAEVNERITTSELVFGFLLIEMIYDRKATTPTEFQQTTYVDCVKTYRSAYDR